MKLPDALIKAVIGSYTGPYDAQVVTDHRGFHTLRLNLPRSMQGYFVPTMRQVLNGDVVDVDVTYTHVPSAVL